MRQIAVAILVAAVAALVSWQSHEAVWPVVCGGAVAILWPLFRVGGFLEPLFAAAYIRMTKKSKHESIQRQHQWANYMRTQLGLRPAASTSSSYPTVRLDRLQESLLWQQIERLVPLIVRDFITSWYYDVISDDDAVPISGSETLTALVTNAIHQSSLVDGSMLMEQLVHHVVLHLQRALHAVRHSSSSEHATTLFQSSSFHPATHDAIHPCGERKQLDARRAHFRQQATAFLRASKPLDVLDTPLTEHVIESMLASCILEPSVETLATADYVRQLLLVVLEPLLSTTPLLPPEDWLKLSQHDASGHAHVDSDACSVSSSEYRSLNSLHSFGGSEPSTELYSIHIPSYSIEGDHAEFDIQLLKAGEREDTILAWTIKRRYRDFVSLHDRLKMEDSKRMKTVHLPHRRNTLFSSQLPDHSRINNRRLELDTYLQTLLSVGLGSHPILVDFLSSTSVFYTAESRAKRGNFLRSVTTKSFRRISTAAKTVGSYAAMPITFAFKPFFKEKDTQGSSADATVFVQRQEPENHPSFPFISFLQHFHQKSRIKKREIPDKTHKRSRCPHVSRDICNAVRTMLSDKEASVSSYMCSFALQCGFGGVIDQFFDELLEYLFCDYQLAFYCHQLMDSFWPEGMWIDDVKARDADEIEDTMRQLDNVLQTLLGSVVVLSAHESPASFSAELMRCFESDDINRHLLLNLFDILIASYALADAEMK